MRRIKSILLVEDHREVREVLVESLKCFGYEIVAVDNGCDAWLLLGGGNYDFDLIISDNQMPVMTGLELLVRVKTDKRFKDTIYILMSTSDTVSPQNPTELDGVCAELGATFCLKPFIFDELSKIIGE